MVSFSFFIESTLQCYFCVRFFHPLREQLSAYLQLYRVTESMYEKKEQPAKNSLPLWLFYSDSEVTTKIWK